MSSFSEFPFRALPEALLPWYAACARPLPWRETKDPYRVWISEIMLQQTRVAAVLEYYARFLAALPDVFRFLPCKKGGQKTARRKEKGRGPSRLPQGRRGKEKAGARRPMAPAPPYATLPGVV